MPTSEELLYYLHIAEEQLQQAIQFEDVIRDLSLKIYYLNKANTGPYQHTLTAYLKWLESTLLQLAEETDILTTHRDHLEHWLQLSEESVPPSP